MVWILHEQPLVSNFAAFSFSRSSARPAFDDPRFPRLVSRCYLDVSLPRLHTYVGKYLCYWRQNPWGSQRSANPTYHDSLLIVVLVNPRIISIDVTYTRGPATANCQVDCLPTHEDQVEAVHASVICMGRQSLPLSN